RRSIRPDRRASRGIERFARSLEISKAFSQRFSPGSDGRWLDAGFPGLQSSTYLGDGTDKGWNPFWTYGDNGGDGGIGDVDELEMRACRVALRWRQGRSLYRQEAFD